MQEPKSLREAAAGGGMGLLVGFLVGMSITPVVGAVIAGLTALLSAFLGLTDKVPAASGQGDGKIWRIASFGVVCVVGVAVGVGARANGWLITSPKARVTAWTDAGFTPERARELVTFAEFGLAPAGAPQRGDKQQGGAGPRAAVLFGAPEADCTQLRREAYGTEVAREQAFIQFGGRWKAVTDAVVTAPPKVRADSIEAAWQLACSPRGN